MTEAQNKAALRDDFMEFMSILKKLRDKRNEIDKKHGVYIADTILEPGFTDGLHYRILVHRGIDDISEALNMETTTQDFYGLAKYFRLDRALVSQNAERNSTRFLRAFEKPNRKGT